MKPFVTPSTVLATRLRSEAVARARRAARRRPRAMRDLVRRRPTRSGPPGSALTSSPLGPLTRTVAGVGLDLDPLGDHDRHFSYARHGCTLLTRRCRALRRPGATAGPSCPSRCPATSTRCDTPRPAEHLRDRVGLGVDAAARARDPLEPGDDRLALVVVLEARRAARAAPPPAPCGRRTMKPSCSRTFRTASFRREAGTSTRSWPGPHALRRRVKQVAQRIDWFSSRSPRRSSERPGCSP